MATPQNDPGTPELFNIVPGMIDSHCHLSALEARGVSPEATAAACFARGMTAILDIGVTESGFRERLALASAINDGGHERRVHLSLGLYPAECGDPNLSSRLSTLESHLSTNEVAAVGEIGLDFHHEYGTPDRQMELFRAQLEIAARFGLPVIIHNRDADAEVLEAIAATALPRGGIMHCFGGNYELAAKCIDHGFLISFAGNVTFRNADALRDVARRIPLQSLLVETDSPYLAPVPMRGRPNHPGLIGYTYEAIAECRGTTLGEVINQVAQNFAGFLGPAAAP